MTIRPKTSSRTPQTMSAVVEDPVDGMVPVEPDVLPPVLDPPTTGVAAAAITNVTVRCGLDVPVMVTV